MTTPPMDGQMDMFDALLAAGAADEDKPTPGEKFAAFDEANPAVYALLRDLALSWHRRTGGRKIGAAALVERLRWEVAMTTTDPNSGFKVNNSYIPFYARKLIGECPELDGMFELRRSVADETFDRAA